MAFGSAPRRRSSRTSRNASPVNVPMTLSSPLAVSETVPRQPPSQGSSSSTHPSNRASMKRRLSSTVASPVNSLELENGEDDFDDKDDVAHKADGDGGIPTARARQEEAEVQKDGSSKVPVKNPLEEDSIPPSRKIAADDDVTNGTPMSGVPKSNGEPKADPREEVEGDGQPRISSGEGDSRDKGFYRVVAESIAARRPSSEEAGKSASQAPQQSVVRIVSEVDKAEERSVSSTDAERHDNGERLKDRSHQSQRIDDLREATPSQVSDLAHATEIEGTGQRGPLSKLDSKQEMKKLPGMTSSDNATRRSPDTQFLMKPLHVARPNTNGEDALTCNQASARSSSDNNEQITPRKSQPGPETDGQPGEGASSTQSYEVANFTKGGSSAVLDVEQDHDNGKVSNKHGPVYDTVAQHLELSSGSLPENDVVTTAADETRPLEANLTIEKRGLSKAPENTNETEGTMNAASNAVDSSARMEKEPHEFKRRRESSVTVQCPPKGKKTKMDDTHEGQSIDQEVVKDGLGTSQSPGHLKAKRTEKGIEESFDGGDIKAGPVLKTHVGGDAHDLSMQVDSKDKRSSSDSEENGIKVPAIITKDGNTSGPESNKLSVSSSVKKIDIRSCKRNEAVRDTEAKEIAGDEQSHGMGGLCKADINAAAPGSEIMGSGTFDNAVPLPVVSASINVNDQVAHMDYNDVPVSSYAGKRGVAASDGPLYNAIDRQGDRLSRPQSHHSGSIEKTETLEEKSQRHVETTDSKEPYWTINRAGSRMVAMSDVLISESSRKGRTDVSKEAEQGGIQWPSEKGKQKVIAEDSRRLSNRARRGSRMDSVEALKVAIYVESSKVHFGGGAERLFVEYWERVGMYLGNAKPMSGCRSSMSFYDSTPDAKTVNSGDGIETFLEAFLRTKKMRRLHNELVCALMKQSVRTDVSEEYFRQHIPTKWRCKIRRKRSVKSPKPGLVELVDPSVAVTRGADQQEIDILSQDEEVCDIHKLQASFAIDSGAWATGGHDFVPSPEATFLQGEESQVQMDQRHETSLPAGCLPGALVIDPLVRDFCARESLTVSEHAIWLLIVAVRQHATSILKKAVNGIHGSYNGSARAEIDNSSVPSSNVLDSCDGEDLYRDKVLLSRKRSLITSFDLAQVVADNPLLGGGSSNSSSSRLAWERFVSSTGAKMLSMAPGASHAVQATINRKIEDASFKRRRVNIGQVKVGETSQLQPSPRKGPAVSFAPSVTPKPQGQATLPPNAETSPSDGKPCQPDVATEGEQRNVATSPNEPRGRGRGVKDLSALRLHKAQQRKAAPTNAGSSLPQSPAPDARSSRDTTAQTAVAAATPPSLQRPAGESKAANASASTGEIARLGSSERSPAAAHSRGADRAATASPSKQQGDGTEDANSPSPAQVVRRRGFGCKDLAALRARRVSRGGAETNDKNDSLGEKSTPAAKHSQSGALEDVPKSTP